jgi:hypothetical protein
MSTPVRIGIALVSLAAAVWVGLTYIAPGIDPLHALAWGNVLSDGVRPKLTSQLTPLSHPLPIMISVPLGPLGATGAFYAYSILAALMIGLLLYGVYRLARVLAGARAGETLAIAAGVLALVLVLIRPRFELYALQAVFEVPFAALVMLAVALVAEAPRSRPWLPLALLGLAGLLRPEAWLLSILYCGWLAWQGIGGRELAILAALALAAPVIWLGFDQAVASDALQSIDPSKPARTVEDVGFGGAGQGDAEPEAGPDDLLPGENGDIAISYFRTLVGDPLAILGLLVVVAALLPWPGSLRSVPGRSRFALVGGVTVLLTGQNLILATVGLPLVERYFFTPSLILLVLTGSAVWLIPERRWAFGAAGALVALVLIVNPDKPREAAEKPGNFADLRAEQRDLLDLAEEDEIDVAVHSGCGRVGVGGRNRSRILAARPLVAISLGLDLPRVKVLRAPRGKHNQSNFRRDLPTGPPPYLERGIWVYRSECLPGGKPPKQKGSGGKGKSAGGGES